MVPPRPRIRGRFRDAERGLSPVVGVTLMVAITVLLAAVVIVMLTGAADPDVAPTMDSAVSLDATNAGTELTTDHSGGQEIDVQLNGETIATIDGSSTGSTLFLPTAPGDEVHLVASGDDSDVLVRETFDAGEAGDFVAYYPFDEDASELRDHSLNDNHGDFDGGDPAWGDDGQGTYRDFDGSQSVNVPNLNTGDVDVDSFTVAVTFEHTTDGGDRQQLVEHNNGVGEEWHLETNGNDGLQFSVDYDNTDDTIVDTSGGVLQNGETYVAVGTYDGETYRLYLDAVEIENDTQSAEADMDRMRIGNDDSVGGQHFRGRMYEFRLYYTALDDHEVEMLTKAMD